MALLELGGIDLWDDDFTGFAYADHKRVVALLGSGASSTGNSVLMEGSKGYREAKLSFTVPGRAQKDLIRGWEETSETVTFTEHDGSTRDVRLLSFDAALLFAGVWKVTVRLQELTEPAAAGS